MRPSMAGDVSRAVHRIQLAQGVLVQNVGASWQGVQCRTGAPRRSSLDPRNLREPHGREHDGDHGENPCEGQVGPILPQRYRPPPKRVQSLCG